MLLEVHIVFMNTVYKSKILQFILSPVISKSFLDLMCIKFPISSKVIPQVLLSLVF